LGALLTLTLFSRGAVIDSILAAEDELLSQVENLPVHAP
jgi:hypothetical protein